MAANDDPVHQLQTCIRVSSIHCNCEGCKRKLIKILSKVPGVEFVAVDAKQHKVTVTGNVEADILIQKLTKFGKIAELWPQPIETPFEKSQAAAAPIKADEAKINQVSAATKILKQLALKLKKKKINSCHAAVEKSNGGGNVGKTNKEGQTSPPHRPPPPPPAQPIYDVCYNLAYPTSISTPASYAYAYMHPEMELDHHEMDTYISTPSYYDVPPPPYRHPEIEPPSPQHEMDPLAFLERFNEENPNGCLIM